MLDSLDRKTLIDRALWPGKAQVDQGPSLVDLLCERGLLATSAAASRSGSSGLLDWEEARALGVTDHDAFVEAYCEVTNVPRVDVQSIDPDRKALDQLTFATANRHAACPLFSTDDGIVVAFADPSDQRALDAVAFECSRPVIPVAAPRGQIVSLITGHYEPKEIDALLQAVSLDYGLSIDTDADNRAARQAPVGQIVEHIIHRAIRERVSDIHIQPAKLAVRVLYRIDGTLVPIYRFDIRLLPVLVARIKILGDMDVTDRRMPQDGHAVCGHLGHDVDLRISSIPTVKGESVVIRILDSSGGVLSLRQIGLTGERERRLRELGSRKTGIFLVAGPTGSGKSTTLYALVDDRYAHNNHVVTVEDPVEIQLDGVEQIQIKPKIGFTFAETLRHILRHDPDDILVGEMRDLETAEIAIKASLTGHFVMSTLHTNDAPAAITRLVEMGIEPYMITSSLAGVLAQRLLRRLCQHCRSESGISDTLRDRLSLPKDARFFEPVGCSECHNTGFKGRVMVCELLVMTDELRSLVLEGASSQALRVEAERQGMEPLSRHAIDMAIAGTTSLEEAMCARVEI